MKTCLRIALVVAGLSLFACYAAGTGLQGAGEIFARLGWLALLLPLPYSLVYLVDTVAWRLAFAALPPISFARFFRIRWAGEAVSNVIPSAYVGGEVVKVHLLQKYRVPVESAAASVVVSKTAQTVAQVVFIATAACVFLQMAPAHSSFRSALWGVVAVGVGGLGLFFWLQRRGLFGSLMQGARFLRVWPAWLERMRPAMVQSDTVMRAFYSNHRVRFLASTATYFAGWLCDTVEIFIFAWLSGAPISWAQALVVESFTGIAKALGWFVPGSAGIQESGVLFAGRLAGVSDDVCVSYALFRRSRELLYALIGWGLLALEEGGLLALRRLRTSFNQTHSSTQLP